jgi:hypothetical protein
MHTFDHGRETGQDVRTGQVLARVGSAMWAQRCQTLSDAHTQLFADTARLYIVDKGNSLPISFTVRGRCDSVVLVS